MNKYELAVVLSAKLEDEERAAAIEKVKGYITRFGGTVTNVDEKAGLRDPEDERGLLLLYPVRWRFRMPQ